DVDAGETKKSQKPVRRVRKHVGSVQGEGCRAAWHGPRSSASSRSHSSCDEGEEPAHTCSASPSALTDLSRAQATQMNFGDTPEGEGDPKTGNTCNALSGAFSGVSNIFSFWGDSRGRQYQELPRGGLPSPPPLNVPMHSVSHRHRSEVENRLDLLQKQLTRLETRMATDISTIMQLLQRQMALVPPAYSTVSSPPQSAPYPEPGERLVQPVTLLESETLASLSQILDSRDFEEIPAKQPEFLQHAAALLPTGPDPLWVNPTDTQPPGPDSLLISPTEAQPGGPADPQHQLGAGAGAGPETAPRDLEAQRRLSLPEAHKAQGSRTPQRYGSDPGS
ncbi:hypothetical protein AAFF_G00092560, partial [Aldrovandia affinis]